ncbi:tyrosine-protein kinase Src42A-like [Littorina saxatilis]|uniref:tyrosine-protein kinase Src42A-like n=1 Tax=Littorina saxatilis TaxID=31220 RepID=UPI0038B4B916
MWDERDDKPFLEACDTVNPSDDIDNNPYEDNDKPRSCGSSAIRLPGDIDNVPWYFGMIPKEEELRLLLAPGNGHGSFMIRDSNSFANQYTLAVRFGYRVSCYRINQTEERSGFYIENGGVFPTLSDLVDYYIEHAGCLQDPLLKPCKRNRDSVYLEAV